MALRYTGTCRLCAGAIPAGAEAVYERATRSVRCLECPSAANTASWVPAQSSEPAAGLAGSSARREYDRRRAKREDAVRSRHPRIGGLILAVTEVPQSTRAWERGAVGEERVGAMLDRLAGPGLRVLHDRRIPGSRANIDHLATTATGVWVIDAKRYRGRPELRVEGGLVRPRVERLFVAGRDCTKLVDGVLKQVDLVRAMAGDVPVTGALCFVDADWPLIGGGFATRGVHAVWPKRLATLLREEGCASVDIDAVDALLAQAFPAV